ncbi:DoxX family protein [Kitasatospora sp. MBT66]|uniref:DoxX family protein n=1 Tax=Kitasatospora sp. MBT66 TaxID=1444769 RepID=UPI0005BE9754|nr:DoxX family protein [Kitasatospora sp. MBT66]
MPSSSPSTTAATTPLSASGSAPGSVTTSPHAYDVGLLLLRVALGLTMAAHGSQKLFGWFGGGGIDGTGQFFEAKGYPAPKVMAVVAGLTEAGGGLALAVGLLTPLAAAAILGTMLNALAVTWSSTFFAAKGGSEYELLLIAAAAALALTGPGRYAADRYLPVVRAHRLSYGAAAVVLALVTAGAVLLARN